MEADFMEQQARFLNKLLLLAAIFLSSCNADITKPQANIIINKTDAGLKMINGILYANDQPFSGTMFELYEGTTDTANIETYHLGKEDGEWKKFYPLHKLKEKRFFKQGKKWGEYIAYWENGNMQLQYFFADGEYEGTCREWSEDGLLSKKMNYSKGHEEGHQQCWYGNGKIKANYIIKDGRRYGLLGTKNCTNVSDSIF